MNMGSLKKAVWEKEQRTSSPLLRKSIRIARLLYRGGGFLFGWLNAQRSYEKIFELPTAEIISSLIEASSRFLWSKNAYVDINRRAIHYYERKSEGRELSVPFDLSEAALAQTIGTFPAPDYSVALPSKFSGNGDHKLVAMLLSLYLHAVFPERAEILIGVDGDDDLKYFHFVKELFANKLNIRVIVSGGVKGYAGLHLINDGLTKKIASTSGGILSLSDDSYVGERYWDMGILPMVTVNPQRIYMAHALPNEWSTVSVEMEFSEFLSELWRAGPRSFHPFLSRALIEKLASLTAGKQGWGVFGNSVMSDSFFEILAYLAEKEFDRNLLLPMPRVGELFEQTLTLHKQGGVWGNSPVIREGLRVLYSRESLAFVRQLACGLAEGAPLVS